MSRLVVATHGHCFDGLASATVFTALHRALHRGETFAVVYRACDYGPGDSAVPAAWLDGDDNAMLDFRYTAVPTLGWYFDHHATAFRSPADRARFDAGLPEKGFYEPTYSSCTKLIADVARDRFGIDVGLAELVRWADIVDAARFPSAEAAVDRRDPELQLVTVVEHHGDDAFVSEIAPRLLHEPLADVARSESIQARYRPLEEKRRATVERMRARAQLEGDVATCDLGDGATEAVEKFAMYALFPTARYAVVVAKSQSKAKVSVGFNPWSGRARTHDIGAMCERHGGGGHPVVGAVTLSSNEIDRARAIARALVAELLR